MAYSFSRSAILFCFGGNVSLEYNPDLYHLIISTQALVHIQFRDGLCLFWLHHLWLKPQTKQAQAGAESATTSFVNLF
jgi:hypothetical protein